MTQSGSDLIYLDNNATTAVAPEVIDSMNELLRLGPANASSSHSAGAEALRRLTAARDGVAESFGARSDQITFTSGGTEANAIVLLSVLSRAACGRIVTTSVEHPSVLHASEHLHKNGYRVEMVGVDTSGRVLLEDLETALEEPADLVSIQWVNNETGVVQPLEAIAALCLERGVPLHTDAAQAVGKMHVAPAPAGVCFMTLTAHKFHGPAGVGAIHSTNPSILAPLAGGGTQERGVRPGTENLPGIIGLWEALRRKQSRIETIAERGTRLRNRLEEGILAAMPSAVVNGADVDRIWNTTNITFPGIDGQALVARLDQNGLQVSQSSACTNRAPEPSHVLVAMQKSRADAYSTVRFSLSEFTTAREIEEAVAIVQDEVSILDRVGKELTGRLP